MIIHDNRRWSVNITENICPYAIHMSNDAENNIPSLQNAEINTSLQLFTKTKVNKNPKHFILFGFPVYLLESALQSTMPFHKWKERSRKGI